MRVAILGKLIDESGDEMITVRTPYDIVVVDAIKSSFCPVERRWLPEHKIWAVADYRKTELVALLQRHDYRVQENPEAEVVVLKSRTSYPTDQARALAEQNRVKAKAAKDAARARALAEQSEHRPAGQTELFPSSPFPMTRK